LGSLLLPKFSRQLNEYTEKLMRLNKIIGVQTGDEKLKRVRFGNGISIQRKILFNIHFFYGFIVNYHFNSLHPKLLIQFGVASVNP